MESGAALLATAIWRSRSIMYCSTGPMFGSGVLVSCALACHAVPSSAVSAKPVNATARNDFRVIDFSSAWVSLQRIFASAILLNPVNRRPILASRSPCPVLLQDSRSTIRGLLGSRSNDYHRSALFHVTCIKFLLADVIRLRAGLIAHLAFLERPAFAK